MSDFEPLDWRRIARDALIWASLVAAGFGWLTYMHAVDVAEFELGRAAETEE